MFDLISLFIVVLDVLVIIAFFMRPTAKINKVTPFYAEVSGEPSIITEVAAATPGN